MVKALFLVIGINSYFLFLMFSLASSKYSKVVSITVKLPLCLLVLSSSLDPD